VPVTPALTANRREPGFSARDKREKVAVKQITWEKQIAPEIGLLDRIRRPSAKLCEGWACLGYDSPDAFRMLPESVRVRKALNTFGPKGAWWPRHRGNGLPRRHIAAAVPFRGSSGGPRDAR